MVVCRAACLTEAVPGSPASSTVALMAACVWVASRLARTLPVRLRPRSGLKSLRSPTAKSICPIGIVCPVGSVSRPSADRLFHSACWIVSAMAPSGCSPPESATLMGDDNNSPSAVSRPLGLRGRPCTTRWALKRPEDCPWRLTEPPRSAVRLRSVLDPPTCPCAWMSPPNRGSSDASLASVVLQSSATACGVIVPCAASCTSWPSKLRRLSVTCSPSILPATTRCA